MIKYLNYVLLSYYFIIKKFKKSNIFIYWNSLRHFELQNISPDVHLLVHLFVK
jgi:hypothetical protein